MVEATPSEEKELKYSMHIAVIIKCREYKKAHDFLTKNSPSVYKEDSVQNLPENMDKNVETLSKFFIEKAYATTFVFDLDNSEDPVQELEEFFFKTLTKRFL